MNILERNFTMYRMIDRLEEDYDYGTGPVKGDDIFDTRTLGGFSFIAQAIPGNRDEEYMKTAKNRVGKIVMMSPKEYYDICAKRFHTSPEELRRQRGYDRNYIEKLKEVITEKKVKFPMTFIDLTSEGSQEGLHRMLAAAELFGWDHKFPVLIVDWFDKEKHEREVKEEEQWRKYHHIERALMEALYYSYSTLDEFKDQLEIELQKELDGSNYPEEIPFELKLDGDNSYIIVDEINVPFKESKLNLDVLLDEGFNPLYQLVGLYSKGNLAMHVAFPSFDEAFKTGKKLIEQEPEFQQLKLIDYNTKETLCEWMWIPGVNFWQFNDLSGMASPEKDLSEDTSKHIYGHNWGYISHPCFEKTDFKENKQEVADWWNKHMAEAQNLSDDALIEWAENTEDYLTDFASSAYYIEEEIQEMINEIKSYKVTDLSESILAGEFYLRFDKKTTKNSAYYAYLDYQGHIHWTKNNEKATKFNYDGVRQIIEQAIEQCKKVFFDSKKDRDYFEKNYGYYLAPVKVGYTNVDLSEDEDKPKYFYISFRQNPETKEDDLYYLGPNYKERNLKKKFSKAYWTQNRDEMHVFDLDENWWKIREEAIERFNNQFDIERLGIKNLNDLYRHIGVRNYTDNNKVDLSEKFQEGFKADAIKEDKLEGMYEEMLAGQWNPQDKTDVKDYLDMLTDWSTGGEEIKESWLWREALQDEYKKAIEKLEKQSNKSLMQEIIKECIRDIMFGYRFWEMNNEDLSEKLK